MNLSPEAPYKHSNKFCLLHSPRVGAGLHTSMRTRGTGRGAVHRKSVASPPRAPACLQHLSLLPPPFQGKGACQAEYIHTCERPFCSQVALSSETFSDHSRASGVDESQPHVVGGAGGGGWARPWGGGGPAARPREPQGWVPAKQSLTLAPAGRSLDSGYTPSEAARPRRQAGDENLRGGEADTPQCLIP